MDSITQDCRRQRPAEGGDGGNPGRWSLGLVWVLLLSFSAYPAWGAEFVVRGAETQLVDGVYRLDAQLQLEFGKSVLEALDNGVPVTIVLAIEMRRARQWVWDQTIADLQQRYQLRHHALSNLYVIRNLNSGAQASYASLGDALRALGTVSRLPVLDARLLSAGEAYYGRLRVALDKEALPSPLRPMAYLSNSWRLGSDWFYWPLQQPD